MPGMFRDRFGAAYAVEPIPAMNEIYVASSHHNNNSDTVFYTQHCDGPWSVYPFCHVYRVMCAVNENVQVETLFTMERGGRDSLTPGCQMVTLHGPHTGGVINCVLTAK
jgi:hypothetical protein